MAKVRAVLAVPWLNLGLITTDLRRYMAAAAGIYKISCSRITSLSIMLCRRPGVRHVPASALLPFPASRRKCLRWPWTC